MKILDIANIHMLQKTINIAIINRIERKTTTMMPMDISITITRLEEAMLIITGTEIITVMTGMVLSPKTTNFQKSNAEKKQQQL